METKEIISIQRFCELYEVPSTFIYRLHNDELIEIIEFQETPSIYKASIKNIEKMIRLHYELEIHLDAIEVVYKLLEQVESLQDEILGLKNRLQFFEDN